MGCVDLYDPLDNRIHFVDLDSRSKAAKRHFRYWIYRQWGFHCAYCGEDLSETPHLATLDHIVPRYRNGKTEQSNLLLACPRCNASKGNKEMMAWYLSTPFYLPIRVSRIERWQRSHQQQWVSFTQVLC